MGCEREHSFNVDRRTRRVEAPIGSRTLLNGVSWFLSSSLIRFHSWGSGWVIPPSGQFQERLLKWPLGGLKSTARDLYQPSTTLWHHSQFLRPWALPNIFFAFRPCVVALAFLLYQPNRLKRLQRVHFSSCFSWSPCRFE